MLPTSVKSLVSLAAGGCVARRPARRPLAGTGSEGLPGGTGPGPAPAPADGEGSDDLLGEAMRGDALAPGGVGRCVCTGEALFRLISSHLASTAPA